MKYHYRYNRNAAGGSCLEECPYNDVNYLNNTILNNTISTLQPRIGSSYCHSCNNFIKANDNENWIECRFLTKNDRKEKLKRLNTF